MQLNYRTDPQSANVNNYPTLPEGEYRAQLISADMQTVKSSGIDKLVFTWEIMDGQYRGIQVREYFGPDQMEQLTNTEDRPILRNRIDSIVKAHGFTFTGNTNELLYKPMLVDIKRNGDFTNVRKLRACPPQKLDFNAPDWG